MSNRVIYAQRSSRAKHCCSTAATLRRAAFRVLGDSKTTSSTLDNPQLALHGTSDYKVASNAGRRASLVHATERRSSSPYFACLGGESSRISGSSTPTSPVNIPLRTCARPYFWSIVEVYLNIKSQNQSRTWGERGLTVSRELRGLRSICVS